MLVSQSHWAWVPNRDPTTILIIQYDNIYEIKDNIYIKKKKDNNLKTQNLITST